MIKKALCISFLAVLFSAAAVLAQCTPDTNITIAGIYPDSATGLPPAYVGTPYSEVVQLRIPIDTLYLGQLVPITNFTIDSITGLPPSFSYACNPGTCIFPGGSNGCILISGSPSATGTFPLNVYAKANGILFGNPATLPFTLGYYQIVIHPASGVGIEQHSNYSFGVSQNEPNPFSVFSDINIMSPSSGKAELKVYNLIGKEIFQKIYRINTGKNSIRVDASGFDSGVYVYTVTMGNQTITKRMVISKK